MKISERDLFDFVFYPENLSSQKVEYLKTSKVFDEEINYYRTLKKSLAEELPFEVKQKIADRIPIYKLTNSVMLYPVKAKRRKPNGTATVLAADSPEEKPFVTAKTFIDHANHYLIRLLNFKNSSKIFVFSTTDEILRNYKVIVKPSGQSFEQIDNSSPIEISTPIEAENIELQFN